MRGSSNDTCAGRGVRRGAGRGAGLRAVFFMAFSRRVEEKDRKTGENESIYAICESDARGDGIPEVIERDRRIWYIYQLGARSSTDRATAF